MSISYASTQTVSAPSGVRLLDRKQSRTRANLRASCLEGAAFGGMVGLGETFLPAFVLAIGLGELIAGLVGSLPLVAGGAMQMISPMAVRKLGSHKRWVVLCAAVQAATFIPLLLAACVGWISSWAVFVVAAVYWAAGLATGPAWNTWIGTLVPPPVRHRFFAIRTRGQQAAIFAGFLIGGLTLQWATANEWVLPAFALLFGTATVCRILSVMLLASQSEPTPIPPNMRQVPWPVLIRNLGRSRGGKLLVYLVAVQAAVQMSGPYFTPFMFQKLNMSYAEFVGIISVAFITKVIAFPTWGRIAKRMGARRLLWIGGIGIVPMSACWIYTDHLLWLLAVQVTSGIVWAAYELAFFLLFFESIEEDERTSLLTLYNLINTIAWVCGALLGAAILYAFSASLTGYLVVFVVSSIARLLALLLLARLPADDVPVEVEDIGVRSMAVRPNNASLDMPVLPSLPDQLDTAANDLHEKALST